MVIVTVPGKVRNEPELRYTPSGTAVLSFLFSKNVGTKDNPEFNNFRATIFGAMAERLAPMIRAGTRFVVTGKQVVKTYQRKDGSTGVSIEITVLDFEFVGEREPEEQREEESIPF